jgi:non-heme chloroperoxidase
MLLKCVLGLILLVLVFGAILAAMIAFGTARPPRPMDAISAPFKAVDFSDLPAVQSLPARDGARLAYRVYPAAPDRVAVLVHGSSATGASMHVLAKAIAAAGFTVYALDMRGHGQSGNRGDIAYLGQLDDDIADTMAALRARHPNARFSLVGFSAGGGFALRIAGGPSAPLFDRILLLSPFLRYDAPVNRPNGGWAAPFIPRFLAIALLHRLGIPWFDGLPVIAYAIQPGSESVLTPTYSYRLLQNFQPHADYQADFRHPDRPPILLVGQNDDLFKADAYAPLVHAIRPDVTVTVVPGVTHIGMILEPAATRAVVAALTADR